MVNARKVTITIIVSEKVYTLLDKNKMRYQANTSTLPMCVACLSICGWGIKRICRHTSFAKTTVHRFMKAHGLTDEFQAYARKAQFNAIKQRKAEASEEARIAAKPFRVPNELRVPLTRAEKAAKALEYYYANHDKMKEASRQSAKKAWQNTIIGSERHMRLVVTQMMRSKINGNLGHAAGKLIGCSWKSLHWHIGTLLADGMGWDTYSDAWLIDCRKSYVQFNLTEPAQQLLCFNWRNLYPRWKIASDGNLTRAPRRILP